jgi:hypothetical protein
MEPRRRKDDGRSQAMKFIVGILTVFITGWIGWVSLCAVAYDKRISVTESVVQYIQSDIKEVKELVRDIRNDQVRRERRENGK